MNNLDYTEHIGTAAAKRVVLVDPAGQLELLNSYNPADVDDATTTKYYGFTRPDGTHYILKETVSSGVYSYRYYNGGTDTDYPTAWTNRASKSYDYFYTVF